MVVYLTFKIAETGMEHIGAFYRVTHPSTFPSSDSAI